MHCQGLLTLLWWNNKSSAPCFHSILHPDTQKNPPNSLSSFHSCFLMWPLQPKPHPYLGHLLHNISKIWPFLSAWWVHLLLELFPIPYCQLQMLPRDDLSSLLFEASHSPFSWSPNPMHKSLSPCLRALCPLPWQNLFPWMWEIAISLHLLLPCCFWFGLLCILAISSAVAEQHQERLTVRKTQAERSSQGAALRAGGM